MARNDGRNDGGVKRRIAATAATAAIALGGPAVAARPAGARTATPPRTGEEPVARIAVSDQAQAAGLLEISLRMEMAGHREHLASALAAELDGADPAALERAFGDAETRMSIAYARGERPDFPGGLPRALAESAGTTEEELTEAFESMSRHALDRRRGASRDDPL